MHQTKLARCKQIKLFHKSSANILQMIQTNLHAEWCRPVRSSAADGETRAHHTPPVTAAKRFSSFRVPTRAFKRHRVPCMQMTRRQQRPTKESVKYRKKNTNSNTALQQQLHSPNLLHRPHTFHRCTRINVRLYTLLVM